MENKIRILIADDKEIFRTGITRLLNDFANFEVAGQAENGKELLDLMHRVVHDVVLLDLRMPVMDGYAALAQIRLLFPASKVILFSDYGDAGTAAKAIACGARGFLPKQCPLALMDAAITAVHAQGFFMEEAVLKDLVAMFSGGKTGNPGQSLSHRESEIFTRLCMGKTEKEIAGLLNISPSTVHFHKMNLYKKTKAHNLGGLLDYFLKNSFTLPPGHTAFK